MTQIFLRTFSSHSVNGESECESISNSAVNFPFLNMGTTISDFTLRLQER